MNNRKNKIKGFTLIEILIVAGIIAVASVGLYAVANIVSDWRKSSAEVQVLSNVIIDIDNATATTGDYSGLTIAKVKEISNQYNPVLSLASIESPSTNVLHFNYKDINSRICTDFSTKMLSSAKNITAIVNSQSYANDSFKDLVVSCNNDKNEVTIILNRVLANYTLANVVASINPPAPAAPDIVIPTFGGPTPLPVVPGFVPGPTAVIPSVPTSTPVVEIINPTAPGGFTTPPTVPLPPAPLPSPPTTPTQYCWNGQVIYPNTICPIQTKICWDGSVVPVTNSCPEVPVPCEKSFTYVQAGPPYIIQLGNRMINLVAGTPSPTSITIKEGWGASVSIDTSWYDLSTGPASRNANFTGRVTGQQVLTLIGNKSPFVSGPTPSEEALPFSWRMGIDYILSNTTECN